MGNRDESSSDEDHDRDSVTFILGGSYDDATLPSPSITSSVASPSYSLVPMTSSVNTINSLRQALITSAPPPLPQLVHQGASFER